MWSPVDFDCGFHVLVVIAFFVFEKSASVGCLVFIRYVYGACINAARIPHAPKGNISLLDLEMILGGQCSEGESGFLQDVSIAFLRRIFSQTSRFIQI